jgi:hypothetical protein
MTGTGGNIISAEVLKGLLRGQLEHDARFHRDIQGLTLGPRLQHLALHFTKYVGRLAESGYGSGHSLPTATLVDCLIIGLSACNALQVDADGILAAGHRQAQEPFTPDRVALSLAIPVGRLAKACEALDHLENIDYASQMRQAIVDILNALLSRWPDTHVKSIATDISARWQEIASKQIA